MFVRITRLPVKAGAPTSDYVTRDLNGGLRTHATSEATRGSRRSGQDNGRSSRVSAKSEAQDNEEAKEGEEVILTMIFGVICLIAGIGIGTKWAKETKK